MAIKITVKRKRPLWRAGVQHEGTKIYAGNAFSKKQLELLKAEPLLIVEEVPDEVETQEAKQANSHSEEKAGKGKKGKK